MTIIDITDIIEIDIVVDVISFISLAPQRYDIDTHLQMTVNNNRVNKRGTSQ